ncbi:MAG: ISL3 family transposase [Geminicoccales bacterium]
MRVTTAFNRMLDIPGASVASVEFSPNGMIVGLRRRSRRLTCPCGWSTTAAYDRSIRRWRHLDLGACRLSLEAEIRRLWCRACGRVRTETVPWARSAARHTRDLEDVVAWLAQRLDKTSVARLLRVSWEAVAAIVVRVVAEQLDPARLDRLYRIGVDEVSYRKGHRYLTVVADHDRAGAVVWAGEGRSAATLEAFYDELGEERCAQLTAVSLDMGAAYKAATQRHAPHAAQCVDPFHVVKAANEAIDKTRRWAWNQERAQPAPKRAVGRPRADAPPPPRDPARWVKRTRWALLKDPARLLDSQRAVLDELRRSRSVLWRAYLLKEELRDLYKLPDPALAADHLERWLAWARRCRIPAFVALGRTIRLERDRILAAVELGISNSKLEGLNSKIRLINHRGYGHHSAAAVISMIYLCCGGITVRLPTER